MISVIDCGLGNINSVIRMINRVGGHAKSISQPQELLKSEKLILPGVGHFDSGMKRLRENNLDEALIEKISNGNVPLLGICLGMQLLCRTSEEGEIPGLGLIDADVRRFSFPENNNLKIPHMGWNEIEISRKNPLFEISSSKHRFYFVHSFYVSPESNDINIAYANHGFDFCAAFQNEQIFGVQFHPEKSHAFGMKLMQKFISL